MYCPNCGKLNDDDSLFCGNCGASLKEFSEKNCNAPITAQETPDVSSQSAPVISQPTNPTDRNVVADSRVYTQGNKPTEATSAEKIKPVDVQPVNEIKTDSQAEDDFLDQSFEEYESEIEGGNKGKKAILIALVALVILGGGGFAYWKFIYSPKHGDSLIAGVDSTVVEDSDVVDTICAVDEPAVESAVVEGTEIEEGPMVFKGTIGGKYAVELSMHVSATGEYGYLISSPIKYRYTKNNGDWIELQYSDEYVDGSNARLEMVEYYDGDQTGSWDVDCDLANGTISGFMINYKGDEYTVDLKRSDKKIRHIRGNVVAADGRHYPFEISMTVNGNRILNAEYINSRYNSRTNLTTAGIENGEYYFKGKLGNEVLVIRFSDRPPYRGTMTSGSNTQQIEMNL